MKTLTYCQALIVLCCGLATAQQYKVLWNFSGAPGDGSYPLSNLVSDHEGNLYGTAMGGGNSTSNFCSSGGCGVIFKLSPNGDGTWSNTIIYNFCSIAHAVCDDGSYPQGGLTFDASGNLYGTTTHGGRLCNYSGGGCGAVFELSPNSDGTWTQQVLYAFCANDNGKLCLDGSAPVAAVTLDASGNVYGTTPLGGSGHADAGVVFKLTKSSGQWSETVLYNFCSLGTGNNCKDGADPQAGVTFDKAGNLYGTTELSGGIRTGGGGLVYELSPTQGGWSQTILLNFYSSEPNRVPAGAVSFDPLGNLYSTTSGGGAAGSVFELVASTRKERTYSFSRKDGYAPEAGVTVDAKRRMVYGTTSNGGANLYSGTVFSINSSGQETVLYSFCSLANCTDGDEPLGSLYEDAAGNLFGTTKRGGPNDMGVVFEITP